MRQQQTVWNALLSNLKRVSSFENTVSSSNLLLHAKSSQVSTAQIVKVSGHALISQSFFFPPASRSVWARTVARRSIASTTPSTANTATVYAAWYGRAVTSPYHHADATDIARWHMFATSYSLTCTKSKLATVFSHFGS